MFVALYEPEESEESVVYWLRCLGMMLLVYPAMADTVAPTTGTVQVAPAAEAAQSAPTTAPAAEAAQAAPTTAPTAPAAEAVSTAPAAPTAEVIQAQRAVLEKRVTAKWDALIHRDFATAYSFTSPGYRKLYSLDVFKSGFGNKVAWRRVEVANVDFKGDDAATVGINIYVAYYPPQAERAIDMQSYVEEPWVFVDGQWWYLMKN